MEFVEAIENKLGKTAKKNYMDLQPGDVPETYANVDDLFKILISNHKHLYKMA